ncbi:MAG: sulfatase-like hydrolase/transferase [Acidobacteriota bacterium]
MPWKRLRSQGSTTRIPVEDRHRVYRYRSEGLHLATLAGFAVAQPLFDLVARSPQFLVAHGVGPLDLLSLVVVLCVGFPALLLLPIRLAGPLGRFRIHNVLGAGLASAFALQLLKRIAEGPGWFLLATALLVGSLAAAAYHFLTPARLFVSLLSPGLVLFPVLFLTHSPINRFLDPAPATPFEPVVVRSSAPVVLAVFDQLPLSSLLDKQNQIDRTRYPHFAALAEDATWFPNATTVGERTDYALPAILTGQYPQAGLLPTSADHSGNLFSLLAGSYSVKVYEPITRLCSTPLCLPRDSFLRRQAALFSDLAVVYLHLLLPPDLTSGLSPITYNWRDFGPEPQSTFPSRWQWERDHDRKAGPLRFIASIGSGEPQTTFYFLHCLLPHEPFVLLPSGKFYAPNAQITGLLPGERWTLDPLAVELSYVRHLMQLSYVDRLLGKLLSRLKAVGLYNAALVIVTSDHGASFRPGDRFKRPTETNLRDLMAVPLFIKLPRQQRASIDERDIQTIDIAPTVADVLGVKLPWPVEGHSALRPAPTRHRKKTLFFAGATRKLQTAWRHLELQSERVAAKRQVLQPGMTEWASSPVFPQLVGRNLADVVVRNESPVPMELHYPSLYQEVLPNASFVPCLISGNVGGDWEGAKPLDLAVAVNGIIRATSRTYASWKGRKGWWDALVPENSFTAGQNLVEVFVVRKEADHPVLTPGYSTSATGGRAIPNLALQAASWLHGVQTSGFYPQEWWRDQPARWTNGDARMTVPMDPTRPPELLQLDFLHTGPRGSRIEILVNGCQLLERQLGPGPASLSLLLNRCPLGTKQLTIEILSGTFVPSQANSKSNDNRRLGLALARLSLLGGG